MYLKAKETFLTDVEEKKKKFEKFQSASDKNTLVKFSGNAKQRNNNLMAFHQND